MQILPRVAMYVKTHVMMLHSEFCAVCSSLSDVSAKIFLLINIHILVYISNGRQWLRKRNNNSPALFGYSFESENAVNVIITRCAYAQGRVKVAGRPILMRFITFKVAVLFQQWTSVLTSSSMQFVCLSIGIDYSKF